MFITLWALLCKAKPVATFKALFVVTFMAFVLASPSLADEPIIRNSFGMEFVRIPSGTFTMGAAQDEHGSSRDEKPLHLVSISKAFYLGKYEVTQKDWEAVMGSSSFSLQRSYPGRWDYLIAQPGKFIHPDKPATVSWNDVQIFIQKLNEIEGHDRYRLPTEAEWEYACRAGSTAAYSFGSNPALLDRYAWYGEDFATGSIHPVGLKEPNAFGLYDMHGNVWEWVQDYYSGNYYSVSPLVDPSGPMQGKERVVRGGSWHSSATDWRCAFRKSYPPEYRGISIGFRLIMTPANE